MGQGQQGPPGPPGTPGQRGESGTVGWADFTQAQKQQLIDQLKTYNEFKGPVGPPGPRGDTGGGMTEDQVKTKTLWCATGELCELPAGKNAKISGNLELTGNIKMGGLSLTYERGTVIPSSGGTINWVRLGKFVSLEIVNVPCTQESNDGGGLASNLPAEIRPIQDTLIHYEQIQIWNGGGSQLLWTLGRDGNIRYNYTKHDGTPLGHDGQSMTPQTRALSVTVAYMCQAPF